jgi:integrase
MGRIMAKIAFTAGRVAGFKCPAGKAQAFLWDVTAPGLGLRATPAGKPSYVFQGRHDDKTIRVTIGSPAAWSIPQAQEKARELQRQIDEGDDPRNLKRDKQAAASEQKALAAAQVEAAKIATVAVGELWAVYIEERREHWGALHYKDHIKLARAGGTPAKRGTDGRGVTIDMPLYPLMALPLRDLTAPVIEAWAAKEAQTRATSARLAWRLLKVFLRWCTEQPAYAGLLPATNPAKTTKSREALGKAGTKSDVLQRGQLAVWFAAVRQIQNPVIAAYLQILLLTGARPGEVMTLQWEDVNTKWKGLNIGDKVEGERTIPLTPYVSHLLTALPRRSKWIFSSPTSESGYLSEPNHPHSTACKVAGIDGVTLHGLRRSFKSLTEWIECPAGVVAQLMGHKPSATAEKHYTVRPLELLALHHEKIEAWILEQAGIVFDAKAAPGALRVVSG